VDTSDDISGQLGAAREMLEGSNIPFTVDLVDLKASSELLKRRVLEQGVLLWSN
jgi:hypothetical protein